MKYRVYITEEVLYAVDVEAEDKFEAEEIAEGVLLGAEDMDLYFVSVEDRRFHAEEDTL